MTSQKSFENTKIKPAIYMIMLIIAITIITMSKAITLIKTATLDNKNDNINSSNYNNKGKARTLMDSYKNKKSCKNKKEQ